jgi:hypothetical protein
MPVRIRLRLQRKVYNIQNFITKSAGLLLNRISA